MQTFFLIWKCLGTLWISDDPVNNKRRWLIEQVDGQKRFKISYVFNGNKACFDESDLLEEAMWVCVAASIRSINMLAHYESELLNDELKTKCQSFLKLLTDSYVSTTTRPDSSKMDNRVE